MKYIAEPTYSTISMLQPIEAIIEVDVPLKQLEQMIDQWSSTPEFPQEVIKAHGNFLVIQRNSLNNYTLVFKRFVSLGIFRIPSNRNPISSTISVQPHIESTDLSIVKIIIPIHQSYRPNMIILSVLFCIMLVSSIAQDKFSIVLIIFFITIYLTLVFISKSEVDKVLLMVESLLEFCEAENTKREV